MPSHPASRRRRRSSIAGSSGAAWGFLAPYLVIFGTFVALPAVYGIWISLHDWDFTLTSHPWVGLENYEALFSSTSAQFADFWNGMKNTGIFTVASVPFLIVIPLALAVLLHQKFPGRTFFRAVFFAPYVLGVAVIGIMWRYLLDGSFGLVNHLLHINVQWTTAQPWAWIGLVGVTVWWTMGFNAVVYLAGLGDISPELYESAELDGANAWQRFRYVTLPGLRQVLIFVLINTMLASANMFGQSYIITQGGPAQTTQTAIMVITNLGFSQSRAGQAAAESYLLAFCLVVLAIIQFLLTRDRSEPRASRRRTATAGGAR